MTAPTAPRQVLVCTQGFPRHPADHRAPFLLDHAKALTAAGLDVTVLCPSGPGLAAAETWDGVRVVRFRYAPRRWETLAYGGAMHRRVRGPAVLLLPGFLAAFLFAAVRRARDADVLHGHWWAPSGLVAVAAARLVGKPAVVHVHGTDAAIARGPLRWLARRVLRAADAVLVASSALGRWAVDVAGPTVAPVVAPMPLGDWLPSPPLSPPPADGPVLAVGRLVPEKGFDVLVRAAAVAATPVELVGDGPSRDELERLAIAEGAPVTLLGSLAPAALADRYLAARLVAVPSRREGFGMVAAEALAAGRAVVASDVGGLPDVVTDGLTGRLVPAGDVDALAKALQSVDPALGRAGPAAVEWLRPAAIATRNVAAYETARAAAEGRPALAPRLVRWGGALFAVLAVAFAVRAIAGQWQEASSLHLDWSAGPIVAAVASVAVANLAMAWLWGWLVRASGGRLGWRDAMRVWWTGQLGRYLPTGLGSVPARVVVGGRAGVARGLLLLTTGAEIAAMVGVTAATAVLLVPGWVGVALLPVALALVVVGFRPLVGVTASKLHPEGGVSTPVAARFLLGHEATFLVRILGFWAVLHLVAPNDLPSLARTAGAMGAAYFLGVVAVFSPGGVGVREAVLVGLLSSSTGPQAAAAAAVAWRLLELAVELPLLAWARTLYAPEPT